MSDTREQRAENRPETGGVVRDLKRLKSDGAASVAELRQFIGHMRGRKPQEMLGLIAKSGLTRSILLATFLFALLLVALTVIPYALYGGPSRGSGSVADKKPAATEKDAAAPDESAPGKQPADTQSAASGNNPAGAPADTERAVDALGIGETRTADPNENPLEHKLDDLLDGVE